MYEAKTKVNDNSVSEYIEKVENPKKREDAYRLLDVFSETTGLEAKMWGDSMIGFGSYHYKYASGHEGDAFLVGFSPRKAKISLYLDLWDRESEILLNELGKHTKGKSCVYVNKLSDIDTEILKKLITLSIKLVREKYPE
ncbi:protein of unknown function (DU1801) [Desulfitobacterium dichloroeliminans LMG P-21439]|uniref:YdhG-like domain-containing protein n=1 Tax=Desulfitobacterium dichloroeliminans (strain LMG P-21439 / DCA1) TaxID=871963 RepID=L0F7K9_DESDL|nr:DUF1801 domain-containing protein [Desulfitobacterium dichloroeliminans]AGA68943.1 protein of unknown function (DU1801) [Desulfitobacterium dichloroeliminans LMG P-21439]